MIDRCREDWSSSGHGIVLRGIALRAIALRHIA
jgi:hypothetical protein